MIIRILIESTLTSIAYHVSTMHCALPAMRNTGFGYAVLAGSSSSIEVIPLRAGAGAVIDGIHLSIALSANAGIISKLIVPAGTGFTPHDPINLTTTRAVLHAGAASAPSARSTPSVEFMPAGALAPAVHHGIVRAIALDACIIIQEAIVPTLAGLTHHLPMG